MGGACCTNTCIGSVDKDQEVVYRSQMERERENNSFIQVPEIDAKSQEEDMPFDDWIDSIDQQRRKHLDPITIRKLIKEASEKFGQKNANLTNKQVREIYDKWFDEEQDYLEKDEVLHRLKDMFEAEMFPIADCHSCDQLGKVCYENDGGLSHRIAQGQATREEMRSSVGGPFSPNTQRSSYKSDFK